MKWVVWAALALVGCDFLDSGDAGVRDAGPPAQVAGRWTLQGTGRLYGCDNSRFNTEDLRLTTELVVGQEADALVLLQAPPVGDGTFSFENGLIQENRVYFTTIEEAGETRIRLRFSAKFDEAVRTLRGTFEGDGPGTCVAEGRFSGQVD